ncbi:MAG: HAD-IB family phosphatase, partial [Salinisphaera sp.]|nr:HAD-IB family phosphatase [Salinisphaera sp.]
MTGRVVIFDLDVTLTRYDTFLPFVAGYVRRRPHHWPGLAARAVGLLTFWRWGKRTWVKQAVLRSFLGGERRARVEQRARGYAHRLAESALREQGLQRLRKHQCEGDRVILATASLDVYVEPLAQLLGIDEVIASRVRWNRRDRLAGIDGENCRDWEK